MRRLVARTIPHRLLVAPRAAFAHPGPGVCLYRFMNTKKEREKPYIRKMKNRKSRWCGGRTQGSARERKREGFFFFFENLRHIVRTRWLGALLACSSKPERRVVSFLRSAMKCVELIRLHALKTKRNQFNLAPNPPRNQKPTV